MSKIAKYVLLDMLRNRIVIAYAILLLAGAFGLFMMEEHTGKAVLGLMNASLFVIPLFSLVFCNIYWYNASEFTVLMLSQPVPRNRLLMSLYGGMALSLALAVWIGLGIPLLLFRAGGAGWILLAAAVFLSVIFSGISVLAALHTKDKARGIGLALLLWLVFALLYDAVVLLLLFQFHDYPLEWPMLAFTFLNPIDLARIALLLKLDVSALLGFTGAVFSKFMGTGPGIAAALAAMLLWIVLPLFWSRRLFRTKDL